MTWKTRSGSPYLSIFRVHEVERCTERRHPCNEWQLISIQALIAPISSDKSRSESTWIICPVSERVTLCINNSIITCDSKNSDKLRVSSWGVHKYFQRQANRINLQRWCTYRNVGHQVTVVILELERPSLSAFILPLWLVGKQVSMSVIHTAYVGR